MADMKRNMRQPQSVTKDIRDLQCLNQRNKYLYLDSAPFMAAYVVLLGLVIQEKTSNAL